MPVDVTTLGFVSDPQLTADTLKLDEDYVARVIRWLNGIETVKWPAGSSNAGQDIGPLAGVCVLGDLTMYGGYPNFFTGDSSIFNDFRRMFERSNGGSALKWPVYMGLGNHDIATADDPFRKVFEPDVLRTFMWDYIRTMHVGTKSWVGSDRRAVEPVASYDAELQYDFIPTPTGGVFTHAEWRNWSYNYSVEFPAVHVIHLHNWAGDDEYGRAAGNTWLDKDLASVAPGKPIVICQHMGWDNLADKAAFAEWPRTAADALLDRLASYNVVAVLRGHDHDCGERQQVKRSNGTVVPFYDYRPGSACFNTQWGTSTDRIDAAVAAGDWPHGAKAYLFKGDLYARWDIPDDKFDQPIRTIAGGWPGLPPAFRQGIDCAVAAPDWPYGSKAYIFKGDSYCRWDVRSDRFDFGPRTIADGWRGLPPAFQQNLDAVIASEDWPHGSKAYLFKGDEYIRWDVRSDKVDGPVRKIADGWPGLPPAFQRDIDAAFASSDWPWGSKAYFFKGGQYVRWDVDSDSFDKGPTDIRDGWPGLFTRDAGCFGGVVQVQWDGQKGGACGIDVCTGWVDYHAQMDWKHVYAVQWPQGAAGGAVEQAWSKTPVTAPVDREDLFRRRF